MNFTAQEIALLATLVCFLLLFLLLYLRTKSALKTTQLLNQQALSFNQQSIDNQSAELEASQLLIDSLQLQNNKLTLRLRETEVRLQSEQRRLQEQQANEDKLSSQFDVLSQRIFKDKSEQFKALNQDSINQLLAPFKVQLEGFKQQVNDCYVNEGKERFNLQEEIKKLANINQLMQQEASNLTNALKGDNKQMGNWGEIVLQRILDNSGLREGHEYETQGHYKNDAGQRFLPDVIVHLPQQKHIIIDSKVSLTAYERYFNSEVLSEQKEALKAHALSVRQHIKGLARKDYQNLKDTNSLDYVLLFVAVEPAFIAAIEHDPDLVKLALDNNILLASPTNLMIALRTIENLWRYDSQEKNGRLIADQASKLYDKLRLFSNNMLEVGAQLGKAQDSYDHALKQFSEGRGNLIAQAESLKNMGVTVNKPLPTELVASSQQHKLSNDAKSD